MLVGALVGAFAAYLGGWIGTRADAADRHGALLPEHLSAAVHRRLRPPDPVLAGADHRAHLLDGDRADRLRTGAVAEAARFRLGGAAFGRIVARGSSCAQLLPNTLAPILVAASLNTANAILLESYISFLGYGIQPPVASWGNMLTNAQSDLLIAPWLAIFPGLAITIAVTSFNFVGDGIRDSLDVRL